MADMLELFDSDDKRTKTAKELVNTEIAYVQYLTDIVEVSSASRSRRAVSLPIARARSYRLASLVVCAHL